MPVEINRPFVILIVTAMASFCYAALLMAPGMIGGMISLLGFSPQDSGAVISAELGAIVTSSIVTAFWLGRSGQIARRLTELLNRLLRV